MWPSSLGPPGLFALFAKGVCVNDGEGMSRVIEGDAPGGAVLENVK